MLSFDGNHDSPHEDQDRDARQRPRRRPRPAGVATRAGRIAAPVPHRRRPATSRPCAPRSTRPSWPSTPAADLEPVKRAFDLAVAAHEGQKRATGELYVTHPIASAQILAELGIDTVAIQAALLHDVPEDTEYSLTDVEERFGSEVAQLVDGVTKLSKFSTHSHEQQQAENIRKMLLGDGPGHPRRPDQARRPAPQHAHAVRPP